jgi:hypothetical protein
MTTSRSVWSPKQNINQKPKAENKRRKNKNQKKSRKKTPKNNK